MRFQRLIDGERIVKKFTAGHVGMDVGLGVLGAIPIPWMGTMSVGAAIAAQAPLIYKPMVGKLCDLYGVKPGKRLRATLI